MFYSFSPLLDSVWERLCSWFQKNNSWLVGLKHEITMVSRVIFTCFVDLFILILIITAKHVYDWRIKEGGGLLDFLGGAMRFIRQLLDNGVFWTFVYCTLKQYSLHFKVKVCSWSVLSYVFFVPLCHSVSVTSISCLAAITGDGVVCGSVWLGIDAAVKPLLWCRCRSGWGVCHPQLILLFLFITECHCVLSQPRQTAQRW